MAGTVLPEDETLYVAADGTGDFYSIQRALDAAPKDGALVLVAPGTYREVLTIDKPNIRMRSANSDASRTVIVNDRSAGANGGTLAFDASVGNTITVGRLRLLASSGLVVPVPVG